MATDKRRVQSYVSEDVFLNLQKYADSCDLSLSSAIEQLLTTSLFVNPKSKFSHTSEFAMFNFRNKTESRLKALEYKIFRLENKL